MPSKAQETIATLELDVRNERLRWGKQEIALTPKAFALLRHLVEHRDQLVTKEAVLEAVWPGVYVDEAQVKQFVAELRKVLHDDPQSPRFIETVRGRGYRFIGDLRLRGAGPDSTTTQALPESRYAAWTHWAARGVFVGRDAELLQLRECLARAQAGERQLCFVSGDPGIGKTALVAAFFDQLAPAEDLRILFGQCSAQYQSGEPFFPVLEGLSAFCGTSDSNGVAEYLRQFAPLWLLQMPGRLQSPDFEQLQRQTQGASQERMLREFGRLIEALTRERVLLLWLEDLHWADDSTLSLLAYLADHARIGRFVLIGTYRPLELYREDHSLRALISQLRVQNRCTELDLQRLSESSVAAYIKLQWPRAPAESAPLIYRHTAGNPLFMARVAEELMAAIENNETSRNWQEWDLGIPESLRQMIEQQFAKLDSADQNLLEAASIAGTSFSAATVAAALQEDLESIEQQCEALARRRQFLLRRGACEWPDRTFAAEYEFVHGLYHQTVFERITPSRRVRLHQRVGMRLEQGYAERSTEIAAQLAFQFEHARDLERTIKYLTQAGENALRRFGYPEAIHVLTKALTIIATLEETPERNRLELRAQMALGAAVGCAKEFSNPEVGRIYDRARALCQELEQGTRHCLLALWGAAVYHFVRGDFRASREIGQQLLARGKSNESEPTLVMARSTLAAANLYLGEFTVAADHAKQGIARYDAQGRGALILYTARDPGPLCYSYLGLLRWLTGYPDDALQQMREAVSAAQVVSHPYTLAITLYHSAWLRLFRREIDLARQQAAQVITFAQEHSHRIIEAAGTILHGWALTLQGQPDEGIRQLREGLELHLDTGAEVSRAWHLTLLSEAYGTAGQLDRAFEVIAEAMTVVERNDERMGEAELYRVHGELLLKQNPSAVEAAEACLQRSLEVARRQQAKSLELRSAISLARLWCGKGKDQQAQDMLSALRGWFREGFDTPDQRQAIELLAKIS